MTNEQLAVFLFHIMRQLNFETGQIWNEVQSNGFTEEQADKLLFGLMNLGRVLETNCKNLGYDEKVLS